MDKHVDKHVGEHEDEHVKFDQENDPIGQLGRLS